MNKKTNYIIWLISFIALAALASCNTSDHYGEEITEQAIITTGDILSNPESYNEKKVTVQGTIVRECPTGCWFDLKDETGALYIDLKPSGVAIPQKTNRTATVQGTVSLRGGKPIIIGKGVKIK